MQLLGKAFLAALWGGTALAGCAASDVPQPHFVRVLSAENDWTRHGHCMCSTGETMQLMSRVASNLLDGSFKVYLFFFRIYEDQSNN